jgi:predicted  nucleic acid-binding Zn-ribbon protein
MMRAFLVLTFFSALLQLLTLRAYAHGGEEARVVIELDDQHAQSAGSLRTKFQLVDTLKNVTLSDADLTDVLNQKLQVLIFDPALKIFEHVSAKFENGMWSCESALTTNGNYWFWTEGVVKSDQTLFSTNARVEVVNGNPQNTTPPVLTDMRRASVDGTLVEFSKTKITAKKTALLALRFAHNNKTPVNLGSIMGNKAYITIVSDDGDFLIHPPITLSSSPAEMVATVKIVDPGIYRAWVEYVEDGHAKVAALSFEVF